MYEVDFLPVEHGEKSGDAIALRFSASPFWTGDQVVCVVDGGYTDEGHDLVDHIRKYYETDRVDLVVSTHPDLDHVTGLKVCLEELQVGELLMHRPWIWDPDAPTKSAERPKLRAALSAAVDLEEIALDRGIPISDPFAGESRFDGSITVVGPTEEYYASLVAEFEGVAAKVAVAQRVREAMAHLKQVGELINLETLTDDGVTSPENNSSVIILLQLGVSRLLLTADAGAPALHAAVDYIEAAGISRELDFIQVPHHGSRRNVGPTILDRLLGAYPQDPRISAIVSASKDSPKHPSKQVTNAFRRRGAPVTSTEGRGICRRSDDAPPRAGWVSVEPLPLFPTVELPE
jgi:beta-lactamase superfamily II metal-dependent hydrolase